jgi:hypothetical protein
MDGETTMELSDIFNGKHPEFIAVGPINYAIFEATVEFANRDRRRIKREQNKAAIRASRLLRQNRNQIRP